MSDERLYNRVVGEFCSYSSVGGRANNEDACAAEAIADGCLLVVADGLGGCDRGEVASNAAVKAVCEYYGANAELPDIEEAVNLANSRVLAEQVGGRNMKTTIAVAYVTQQEITLAHVGDSRIYGFLGGELVCQSVDHSASQMAVMLGKITPAQIRHHEDRNKLTRALGVSYDLTVDIAQVDAGEFDALLLCSDGFWEYIEEADMCRCLRESSSPQQWMEKMRGIADAAAPLKRDNNTAVVWMRGG